MEFKIIYESTLSHGEETGLVQTINDYLNRLGFELIDENQDDKFCTLCFEKPEYKSIGNVY